MSIGRVSLIKVCSLLTRDGDEGRRLRRGHDSGTVKTHRVFNEGGEGKLSVRRVGNWKEMWCA